MSLDPRTLFATSLLLGLCLTLVVQRAATGFPTIAGSLSRWSGGTLLTVLGGALLLLRGVAPDVLTILVANTLFTGGIILSSQGLAAFNARAHPTRLLVGALVLLQPVLAWFVWVEPSFRARTVAVNLLNLAAILSSTIPLIRGKEGGQRRFSDVFTASASLVMCLALVVRVLDALLFPQGSRTLFDAGPGGSILLGSTAVATLVLPAGLLLMVGDRVAEEFERRATRDYLTGALNRRGFAQAAAAERARADRQASSLTLLLFDLDRFKQVNDRHGHAAGDALLAYFVTLLGRTLRVTDLLSRHGGEEFLVLLPDTDLAGASFTAERMRRALAEAPLTVGGVELRVTVSIGVAAWSAGESLEDAIRRADAALYRAKGNGRDRVERAEPGDGVTLAAS